MSIDVANESGVSSVDEERLSRLARHVLDAMRVHPLAELSVVLVDEGPMTDLHVRWMDEPGPTDVLSFPMDELRPGGPGRTSDPGVLGDVIICPQVAERQGETAGHGTEAEIDLLCTHGILHLLGYDHAEPEEHKEMFGLQGEILAAWREREAATDETTEGDESAR